MNSRLAKLRPNMKKFKEMYSDKFLSGDNTFCPIKCAGFLYSKIRLPTYRVPIAQPIEFIMVLLDGKSIPEPSFEVYDIYYHSGPDKDGYCLYIYP